MGSKKAKRKAPLTNGSSSSSSKRSKKQSKSAKNKSDDEASTNQSWSQNLSDISGSISGSESNLSTLSGGDDKPLGGDIFRSSSSRKEQSPPFDSASIRARARRSASVPPPESPKKVLKEPEKPKKVEKTPKTPARSASKKKTPIKETPPKAKSSSVKNGNAILESPRKTLSKSDTARSPSLDCKPARHCHLTRLVSFSAAHRLYSNKLSVSENIKLFGKCANANGHGHNYKAEVTVKGIPDQVNGMVMNLVSLDDLITTHIMSQLDHRNLDKDVEYFSVTGTTTTAENIAMYIWDALANRLPKGVSMERVRLHETDKNCVEFYG